MANHVWEGLIPITADFDTVCNKSIKTLGLTLLDTQWLALRYLSSFDYQIISKPWQRTVNGKTTMGIKQELHKDPFDRMILAHGITMDLPVASPDTLFPYYIDKGLNVIW